MTSTDRVGTARPVRPADAHLARRRRMVGWEITGWLTLMMIISWADKGVIGLAAKPIMRDLHLTPSQFGLVGSSMFFLFCLTPIAVGLVANRISTRWVLAALVVVWSAAQAPVLLFTTLPALLASRILLGAAEGPSTSMLVHHIYTWFPARERALPGSIATAGSVIGLAVAAPGLTYVVVGYGWQAAFGVLAVAGLVWVAVWLLIGRAGPFTSYAADTTGIATPGADTTADPRVPYRKILITPTWLGGVAGTHFCYWAVVISATWLPTYLEKGLGYSLTTTGTIDALPPVIGIISMIGSGALARWLAARGVPTHWSCGFPIGVIAVVSGASLLLVPFTSSHAGQIALLAIAFGLPNGTLSLVNLTTAEICPVRQRPAVMAFTVIGFTTAGIYAPYLTGALIQHATTALGGFVHLFLLLGALLLGGGITAALTIRPRRDARRLGLPAA
jgi:MFS family permease